VITELYVIPEKRSAGATLPLIGFWHTFGDLAGWGGLVRSVRAPLYGHETEFTHVVISGYQACVGGGG
jgi:hypothetical protein